MSTPIETIDTDHPLISTNAVPFTISKVDGHEQVFMIFCHFDSWLSGAAQGLLNDYSDESSVDKLISLGDLLKVGKSPTISKDVWDIEEDKALITKFANYRKIPDTCFAFSTIGYARRWYDPQEQIRISQILGPTAAESFSLLTRGDKNKSDIGPDFKYPISLGPTKKYTDLSSWKQQLKTYAEARYAVRWSIRYTLNFIYINNKWYVFRCSHEYASPLYLIV